MNKTLAVIFDIDEVLCRSWRPEFKDQFEAGNFADFEAGIPTYAAYDWAVTLAKLLINSGVHLVFVTARNENYKKETIKWLEHHLEIHKSQYEIHMRPFDNVDKDSKLKKTLWENIAEHYQILFALDDKSENARLWKKLGIPALHVLQTKE